MIIFLIAKIGLKKKTRKMKPVMKLVKPRKREDFPCIFFCSTYFQIILLIFFKLFSSRSGSQKNETSLSAK